MGVPDSFEEHVKLMFDLQALAFAADITRVFSFKLGRDGSAASIRRAASTPAFHPASHHQEREDRDPRVREDQQVPRQPAAVLPREAEEHAGRRRNLLDNTLVIYGSPMGNSNMHNHKRCPLFLAGHANGS